MFFRTAVVSPVLLTQPFNVHSDFNKSIKICTFFKNCSGVTCSVPCKSGQQPAPGTCCCSGALAISDKIPTKLPTFPTTAIPARVRIITA